MDNSLETICITIDGYDTYIVIDKEKRKVHHCSDLKYKYIFMENKFLNELVMILLDTNNKLETTEKALELACEELNDLKKELWENNHISPYGFTAIKEMEIFKADAKEMMESE